MTSDNPILFSSPICAVGQYLEDKVTLNLLHGIFLAIDMVELIMLLVRNACVGGKVRMGILVTM
jgi:hypothetical protein